MKMRAFWSSDWRAWGVGPVELFEQTPLEWFANRDAVQQNFPGFKRAKREPGTIEFRWEETKTEEVPE